MFAVSKIAWLFLDPGNVLLLLVLGALVALWRGRHRLARVLLLSALSVLLCASVVPVGPWLLNLLENRFPPPPSLPEDLAGVIVLGGAMDADLTRARGQPVLHEGAERITAMITLARRLPTTRVIFTGGSGSLGEGHASEAVQLRPLLEDLGVPPDRIIFEEHSRNTHENALNTARLLSPRPEQTWLLVTSASHMPRAVGTFRAAGFQVLAYPVDYVTPEHVGWYANWTVSSGLMRLAVALREVVGLVAYRIAGRTQALFPAP